GGGDCADPGACSQSGTLSSVGAVSAGGGGAHDEFCGAGGCGVRNSYFRLRCRRDRNPPGRGWSTISISSVLHASGYADSAGWKLQCGRMSIAVEIRDRRDEILRIAAQHGAGNLHVFGSVARGEDTPESDVDLLVDVTGETTAWFPGSLVADL